MPKKPRSISNLTALQKAGVLVEAHRLSKSELKAIADLEEAEVEALISAFNKIAKASKDGKHGWWRAFCF